MNRILYLHSVYLYSSGSSKKQLSISCIVLLSTATHMGCPAQRFWGTWWSSCRGTACSGAWCLQPPAVGVPCTDLLHVYCSESLNQRASWQCLDTTQWPPAPVPTTPNSGQGEIYRATPWCCWGLVPLVACVPTEPVLGLNRSTWDYRRITEGEYGRINCKKISFAFPRHMREHAVPFFIWPFNVSEECNKGELIPSHWNRQDREDWICQLDYELLQIK